MVNSESKVIIKNSFQKESETGPKFSYFKRPISNTTPFLTVGLFDVYDYIKQEYAKESCLQLRSLADKKNTSAFKSKNFDYVTFGGEFSSRKDEDLIKPSGLMCFDFDDVKNIDKLKNQLMNDEYFEPQMIFTSPGGKGVKWVVKMPQGQADYGTCYQAISNYVFKTYGVEADKSCKNISRACFLPHDSDVYINQKYNII